MPCFFRKLGKMSQNLSSAAVVIGALRVKTVQNTRATGIEGSNSFLSPMKT